MAEQKPYYILGLDIGIASCGWALIDTANHHVVDLNAHLWDPPQEDKTKTSLAVTRRDARSSRRNTQRTANRKKHCLKLFKDEGLVPKNADGEWLQTVKGDMQPLEARAKGLDEPLGDRAWAQGLYNIIARRGYIPHGESSEGDTEGRKVLSAIKQNSENMASKGYRTVGEMLSKQERSRNKGDDYSHCVTCEQLVNEVRTLFEKQRGFGNEHAGHTFEMRFIDCMTWEADVSSKDKRAYERVGSCKYFPEKKRAAKACLSFELCRAYEQIGHIVIVDSHGSEHKLPAKERENAIRTLFSPVPLKSNKECRVRYSDLRKHLDLPASMTFKGINQNEEGKTEVTAPTVWRKQRELLPKALMLRMAYDRHLADRIDSALAYSSSEKTLKEQLAKEDLSDEEVDSLASLPYSSRAFKGYGNRSLEALDLLIGAFEETMDVVTLSDAEEATGLGSLRRSDTHEKGDTLPPYVQFDPECSNPVVLRAMGRVRRIVNAVIREYGMPDEVHIELARELKHSKKEKLSISKANNVRKSQRKALLKELAENLSCTEESVPGKILRKVELWKEQGGIDFYTDDPIVYERLIKDENYCQIDHILPYSRTCDDSSTNKALTLNANNQDKGNRTPYEWLAAKGTWEVFERRVSSLGQKGYPWKKRQKLLEEHLDIKESEFIERNLNDTRYASRAAKNYIEAYLDFPDNGRKRHVVCTSGGATSALRSAWGFMRKDRDKDDLHHGVDAAIIAACNESAVIKVAKASERKMLTPKADRKKLFVDTEPWPGFSEEVQGLAERAIPTRMVDHSWQGRLFEDTVYHVAGIDASGRALLSVSGKAPKPAANCITRADGSAIKPDGMMFLRLWWDPSSRLRGQAEPGRYLAEPVYRADFANIQRGTYEPRYYKKGAARSNWPKVPKQAMQAKPLILHYGDAVSINGAPARWKSFNIANGKFSFANIRAFGQEARMEKSPLALGPNDTISLVTEDILGQCYSR